MKKFSILFFTFILLSSVIAQKEKLELNLIKGETYRYNLTSYSSTTTTYNKQTVRTSSANSSKVSCKVVDIQDSIYELEVRYDSLNMTVSMFNIAMEFRSTKNDVNDIMSTILSEITNKPFTLKLSKSARIIEVRQTESLFTTLFDKLPQKNETKKKEILSQMEKFFGENGFKSNLNIVFSIFPNSKMSKGSKWSVNSQLENELKSKIKVEYTLKEITDSFFHIVGKSNIKPGHDDEQSEYNGMPSQIKLTGLTTYDIKIDRKSGWIISSNMEHSTKGNVSIKDCPKMPGGMEMYMNLFGKVNISNKEIDSKYQNRVVYANDFLWTYNKKIIPVAIRSNGQFPKMMFLRIEFDENNKPVQINFMQDGISLPMFFAGENIYSYIFEYNDNSMTQSFINQRGMPVNNSIGYCKTITEFDKKGNITSEYYLDKKNQPAKDEYGNYKYQFFQNKSNKYSTCIDPNSKLVSSNEVCEIHFQVDSNDVVIKNTWKDKNNKVSVNENGYAKSELIYNTDYTLKEIIFLDVNDSLCIAKNRNCAKIAYEYDKNGYQSTIKHFGTDGKLSVNPTCNCSIIRSFFTTEGTFDKTVLYDQFDVEIKK